MTGSRRVLVIEDDEAIQGFVGMALALEGYEVVAAPHGGVALDLLRGPADLRPDIILLDMSMPVMDGSSFAQAYRQAPGPHAPIIVITAANDAPERAAQIGAQDVLPKPFDLPVLLERVNYFTH